MQKERVIIVTKKRKFLLAYPKIYNIYCAFSLLVHKIKRIGKSGNCVMCGYCKNKGCMKNRIAQKFRMAGVFGVKCYMPTESDNATTEQ